MKNELFSIGEISKIKDVTIKALRFYDRIGLLKPIFTDPSNGYRYYGADQFAALDIIRAARSMDISPNALIPFFSGRDTDGLVGFLSGHKEQIRQRLASLADTLSVIEQVESLLQASRKAVSTGSIYRRYLPDRHIMTIPFDPGKPEEALAADTLELDMMISRLGLVGMYETGVLFQQNAAGEFEPDCLFSTVLKRDGHDDRRVILGGVYVCVSYDSETINARQTMLWQHLKENQLTLLGLVQTDLLIDLFTETTHFELQARIG